MRINTNIASLNTMNYLRKNTDSLEQAMQRLSSGKRINSAGDDAAGLAIATRMEAATRGMDAAKRNASDGISLIQTAESAQGTISALLQRMRELAVQADNGTNNTQDVGSLQQELDQLVTEITHISDSITFNGIHLLDGTVTSVNLHISNIKDDTITVGLVNVSASGLSVTSLSLSNAQSAISAIDAALDIVSSNRADLGAAESRLNFIIDNLSVTGTNLTSARSRIEDADMAEEMSKLTRNRVLQQSSMAMLQQANVQPEVGS